MPAPTSITKSNINAEGFTAGSEGFTGNLTGNVTGVVTGAGTQAAGSALTVTSAMAGKVIQLDTATGSVCTLPAATGSGATYRFVVTVLATSNSHKIQVANSTDVLRGYVLTSDSDTSDAFAGFNTTATSDTITLNRSTTGSVYIGEAINITDVKAGFFAVDGWIGCTGTPATPFSAAV